MFPLQNILEFMGWGIRAAQLLQQSSALARGKARALTLGPRASEGSLLRLPWKAERVEASEVAASILEATSKHLKPTEGPHYAGGWPVWAPGEHGADVSGRGLDYE